MSINIELDALRNAIVDPWISPWEHYLPLAFRADMNSLVYYVSPYIICRTHVAVDHWCSWLGFGQTFGYGTYEWKAKAANPVQNAAIYLGILEKHHGWSAEGIIAIYWEGIGGAIWQSYTSEDGGGETKTDITAGTIWTNENTFKIEWPDATVVRFYIGGALKSTHNVAANVPAEPMQVFAEVGTHTGAAAAEPFSYFRAASFKEL